MADATAGGKPKRRGGPRAPAGKKPLMVIMDAKLIKKAKQPEDRRPPPRPEKSASVRDLEERLTRALGGPVVITEDEPGKAGRLEIRYMNLDHLERLLDRLL